MDERDQHGQYRAIAEFYDAEYANLDMLGPDVELFLEHLPRGADDPLDVLEIGCGTGRAVRQIGAAGHRCLGFDIDPDMLAIARARHGRGGEQAYRHADAGRADWPATLGFAEPFDACCCFFNTFLALATADEQEACLRGCHAALVPGGTLWLDVFHPNLELIAASIGGADELEPELFLAPDGRAVMRTTSLYADVVRQVTHCTFHYAWHDAGGERRETHRSFDMAWITPRELTRLLRLCGFAIEATYGDHDGGPLVDDSERLIVHATRA